MALDKIDIAMHRPHPPSYLGYVFVARMLRHIFPDANTALVAWNLIATGLAACVIGLFAFEVGDPGRRRLTAMAAIAIVAWRRATPAQRVACADSASWVDDSRGNAARDADRGDPAIRHTLKGVPYRNYCVGSGRPSGRPVILSQASVDRFELERAAVFPTDVEGRRRAR